MSDVLKSPKANPPISRTADEVVVDDLAKAHIYEEIEQGEDFKQLTRARRNFIVPMTIFFIVYYFGMLILINYFPDVMTTNIIGAINLAYLMALSQFVVAWIIAFVYLKVSTDVFDRLVAKIVSHVKRQDEATAAKTARKEVK